jgi:hypothetical protein
MFDTDKMKMNLDFLICLERMIRVESKEQKCTDTSKI